MKVKLKESEIDSIFEVCLFKNNFLCEDLNKTDEKRISKLAKDEIKDYLKKSRNKELEKKIEEVVKDKIKNDKELKERVEEIVRSMIIEVYKNFWTKRQQLFNNIKT
jgi:hypothetical protein